MTNYIPVYGLQFVNSNLHWPIIGHLYCMMSFFVHVTLFSILEIFVLGGDNLTVADFSLIASITTYEVGIKHDGIYKSVA